jgi:TRAP-type C4-dicarboxylate transport system permease large subunit
VGAGVVTLVSEVLKPYENDSLDFAFIHFDRLTGLTQIALAIMILVVIVGTALDMAPTILILTPILMPIVKQAGIDPVYFGVLFIINNAIGLITPPVGVVLNVVCGVSRISMEDVIKGVWPFLIAQLAVLLLMVLFPQLVTEPAKWFGG